MSSRRYQAGQSEFCHPIATIIWSTSIGVKGAVVGSGLAMRTEGTTSVVNWSLDWDGDAIFTVLLKGVGGGRESCGALVCEAVEGRARPRVGVAV